jgi:hypothetical protein
MSNTLVQTAQPVLTGEALLLAQENLLIAALRRPSLSSTMKLTGINERHFPDHLRPAFNIVLTKSQDEIRHLVTLEDSRIWPLYSAWTPMWVNLRGRFTFNERGEFEPNTTRPLQHSSLRRGPPLRWER